jgi:hypothetical protein
MKILQRIDKFDIYDPRKGEDKKIDMFNKQTFSSLKSGFLVIEAYRKLKLVKSKLDQFTIDDINPVMKSSLLKQGGIGFFTFSPATEKARKSNVIELRNVDYMNHSILGYFDINFSNIDLIIEKHRKVLSYEEWIIGSCLNKFEMSVQDELAGACWNIDFLLMQANNIKCLYYFNSDINFLIFLTRIFKSIDEEMSKIVQKK